MSTDPYISVEPCIYCGSTAATVGTAGRSGTMFSVACAGSCDTHGASAPTMELAIDAWNKESHYEPVPLDEGGVYRGRYREH